MQDWTSGYVADIAYTYGYYPELNPVLSRFALLSAGLAPPKVATACELGFGQGVGVNLHAAGSRARWWGTDFNPSHAGFARDLALAAGSQAELYDEAFEDFCQRTDLPEFDFIGVHGIWTWINDRNRAVIVDFVRRKLKVGGVLYVSYNTQPGWGPAAPMRDLLWEYSEAMSGPGQGRVARIDASLAFVERLFALNPRYAAANPLVVDRLKKIAVQDRNYVAHEFFNRDWEPMSYAKFSNWLSPAKVSFACSANMLDHVDALNLTADQLQLLKELPDPGLRQTVRDFCLNQSFRKDYWVKGPRTLNSLAHKEALDAQAFVLTKVSADVALTVAGGQAEAALSEAIYRPVIEALADHKPHTLQELAGLLRNKSVVRPQLLQALHVLIGKGDALPVQSQEDIEAARPVSRKLNGHLMDVARNGTPVHFLASPLTGGGVAVSRFHQLFLLARRRGEKAPQEWVRSVWAEMAKHGQRLTKDGKGLPTPEENMAELARLASDFVEKRLPVFDELEII